MARPDQGLFLRAGGGHSQLQAERRQRGGVRCVMVLVRVWLMVLIEHASVSHSARCYSGLRRLLLSGGRLSGGARFCGHHQQQSSMTRRRGRAAQEDGGAGTDLLRWLMHGLCVSCVLTNLHCPPRRRRRAAQGHGGAGPAAGADAEPPRGQQRRPGGGPGGGGRDQVPRVATEEVHLLSPCISLTVVSPAPEPPRFCLECEWPVCCHLRGIHETPQKAH